MLGQKSFPPFAPSDPEADAGGEVPNGEETSSSARYVLDRHAAFAKLETHHLAVSWGDKLLTLDKSMGFRDNSAFSEAFETIRGSHVYDEYDGPDTIIWRLNTLCWAAGCALRVGADFVE